MESSAPDETQEAPSKTYLLAADARGEQIVSVHVKRTYRLRANGRLDRAEGEIPLLMGAKDPEPGEFDETDIVSFKERTDLILMTKAWGRGAREMTAQIRVGAVDVRYRVFGDRRVIYRGRGSWAFGAPEPFESMEMRYENAYGGFDATVPDPPVKHLIDAMDLHPGEYPRNAIGKGYVVYENHERIDGLLLPNIEHPDQLLTSDRLVVGHPHRWWRQPLPWSCNWFPKLWYPRIVHYRGVPTGVPEDDTQVAEVKLGWLEPGHAPRATQARLDLPLDNRLADAASPALVLPMLRGDESIELTGFTPDGKMLIQLPQDRPRITIQCQGETTEITPVVHRVLASTLENGVYVVWHGAFTPPDPLPGRMPRSDETMATMLEGVRVWVDGQRIAPLGANEEA
jgi:hypothetical protein